MGLLLRRLRLRWTMAHQGSVNTIHRGLRGHQEQCREFHQLPWAPSGAAPRYRLEARWQAIQCGPSQLLSQALVQISDIFPIPIILRGHWEVRLTYNHVRAGLATWWARQLLTGRRSLRRNS